MTDWLKVTFWSIPFLSVLGGTVNKLFRRLGIPVAAIGYTVVSHGWFIEELYSFVAAGLLLWLGYGDKAKIPFVKWANEKKWYGYLGLYIFGSLLGMAFWPLAVHFRTFSPMTLVVTFAVCGVMSVLMFAIHKIIKLANIDAWGFWEALGLGMPVAIGWITTLPK